MDFVRFEAFLAILYLHKMLSNVMSNILFNLIQVLCEHLVLLGTFTAYLNELHSQKVCFWAF